LFPIIGGEGPGLGHIAVRKGALRFAGVTEGLAAQRFFAAADVADAQFKASALVIEVRILEIPALRIRMLWLKGQRGLSRFVSLMQNVARNNEKLEVLDSVRDHIDLALKLIPQRSFASRPKRRKAISEPKRSSR
jgi:hypothetical protein